MVTNIFLWLSALFSSTYAKDPYNVLFVVVDDLRADLGGYYGQNDIVYTPNLDAFQNRAFTFTHAYTQCAICAATRASFLTGTRPDTTRIWNIGPYFRDEMVNGSGKTVVTLPQYFKEHAKYYTVGAGKVFHPGSASGGNGSCNLGDDEPYSWSEPYWDCGQGGWAKVKSTANNGCVNGTGCVQSEECVKCLQSNDCYAPNGTAKGDKGNSVCSFNCSADCVNDGLVTTQILKYFKTVSTNKKQQPWFIGVGLKRPHLPWDAPDTFYNMYKPENVKNAKYNKPPYMMPIKATNNLSESKGYNDINASLYHINYEWQNKNYWIALINDSYQHYANGGYYASVSFMDEQFGRIIQGLYEYDLWDNTIISVTGDHGYHLGEQGCYTKHTNFEVGVRVPLMIRIPGINEGKLSDVLVEQLDMFPTIIDAANVNFTANIKKQLEGKSLLSIIKNPEKPPNFPQYAYSQYPRSGNAPNYTAMGISIRTTTWRYTEWLGWYAGSPTAKPYPIWDTIYGIELYNHSNITTDENDMNGYDNYNLAYNDSYKDIVQQLHNTLHESWDNQTWAINYKYRSL